jgi:DNA-binding transcriptional regulator GbsR (MarR family)
MSNAGALIKRALPKRMMGQAKNPIGLRLWGRERPTAQSSNNIEQNGNWPYPEIMSHSALKNGRRARSGVEPGKLTPVELALVEFFVSLADLAGLPKSVGEIYGLLFSSEQAMAMDEIIFRLGLSKGSASQGLRFLRSSQAVRVVYRAGDRRDFYEPELGLRNLAAGLLKEKIAPRLAEGAQKLAQLEEVLSKESPLLRKLHENRINRIRNWQRNGQKIIPFALKFLKG